MMRLLLLFCCTLGALCVLSIPPLVQSQTPESDLLVIHVVPHTHDDVGWLKTVDQYYYGANNSIQHAGVQYILDSVMRYLPLSPLYRFTYVEMAFFTRWWDEQDQETKLLVQELVASGQLTFTNGGWCMNDEGTVTYEDSIDQMTLGHLFLLETFNVVPRVGWHIDPFGHGSTQAQLFAMMGFDAFFFSRIDYQDIQKRKDEQQMQLVWRGTPSLGTTVDMFTDVMYDNYHPPEGFCFDQGCSDPPIQDDPRLEGYNVEQRASLLANELKERALAYNVNDILYPFGSDFQWENADTNYKNMDKLMKHMNANTEQYGMQLIYSTPDQFVNAVHANNVNYTVKTDDFFPYADQPHAFWTGYLTSRPALKGYVRSRGAFLRATQGLLSTTRMSHQDMDWLSLMPNIRRLQEAQAIAQHHDAVAGTEKQHVADDYAKRLSIGSDETAYAANVMLNTLSGLNHSSRDLVYHMCPLSNVSLCPSTSVLSPSNPVLVSIHNPLAVARDEYVYVAVPNGRYLVSSASGENLPTSTVPAFGTASKQANSSPDALPLRLWFRASVPPLGVATYLIQMESPLEHVSGIVKTGSFSIENNHVSLLFGPQGHLNTFYNKDEQIKLHLEQDWIWYNASAGNNAQSNQPAGAYIMRPNSSVPFQFASSVNVTYYNATFVQEVHMVWNPWIRQIIRLFAESSQIEIVNLVGPIGIEDNFGKEVVTRFSSSLPTNGEWFTDEQGRELILRKKNYRATYDFAVTEPVAGNYVPMYVASCLRANNTQMTLVTDRAQSCASLADGSLEVLVHRRLLYDDHRGVGEPLNETEAVCTRMVLAVDPLNQAADRLRQQAELVNNPLQLYFANHSVLLARSATPVSFAPLRRPLPANLKLLSLQSLEQHPFMQTSGPGPMLLRLAHIYASSDASSLAAPVSVDLNDLFVDFAFHHIVETSLTANQRLSKVKRLVWNVLNAPPSTAPTVSKLSNTTVTLHPMEIRTFLVAPVAN